MRTTVAALVALASCLTSRALCQDGSPSKTPIFEVTLGKPGEELVHSFKTRSELDDMLRRTTIKGPVGFSHPAAGPESESPACMNWYNVTYGGGEVDLSLKLDSPLQDKPMTVQLGPAEYFLTPAQQLTDGPPKDIPEKLGMFKAYRVVSSKNVVAVQAKIPNSFSKTESVALKQPAYICLPCEEQHHEESFEILDPEACWLVYETEPSPVASIIASTDQLGIHRIKGGDTKFFFVPVKTIASKPNR
ncbi:MAG: hypothetical protein AB8B50_06355 [Pirellulaceae bacterium]